MPDTRTINVTCPGCGRSYSLSVPTSVSSDTPGMARYLIRGSLYAAACPACGAEIQPELDLLYNDAVHGAWLWLLRPENPDYSAELKNVRKTSFFTDKMVTRLVSTRDELGEKVSCLEAGRDDRVIALYKQYLMELNPGTVSSRYRFLDGKEAVLLRDAAGNETEAAPEGEVLNAIARKFSRVLASSGNDNYPLYDDRWAADVYRVTGFVWPEPAEEPVPVRPAEPKPIAPVITPKPVPETRKTYTHCPSCGKELRPGARFCTNCGTQVPGTAAVGRVSAPEPKPEKDAVVADLNSQAALAWQVNNHYCELLSRVTSLGLDLEDPESCKDQCMKFFDQMTILVDRTARWEESIGRSELSRSLANYCISRKESMQKLYSMLQSLQQKKRKPLSYTSLQYSRDLKDLQHLEDVSARMSQSLHRCAGF